MTLNGNTDEINGYNTKVKNGELNDSNMVKAIVPPIGAILAWHKTFNQLSTGGITSTTANKLINTGATFQTDGVTVGSIVYDSTDGTFTYVTAVDSQIQLSLAADIFTTTENYNIYATPTLPDGFVECNGQVLSDSDSPYDGATIPSLNANANNYALVGTDGDLTGSIGGKHSHSHQYYVGSPTGSTGSQSGTQGMEVVWIIRVK